MKKATTAHFKESYLHSHAIGVLSEWIRSDSMIIGFKYPVQVGVEKKFYINGKLEFVPDIVIYSDNCIQMFIEVVVTNGVSGHKLWKMQYYQHINSVYFPVFEVSANWIMRQIAKPEGIKYDTIFKDIRTDFQFNKNQ